LLPERPRGSRQFIFSQHLQIFKSAGFFQSRNAGIPINRQLGGAKVDDGIGNTLQVFDVRFELLGTAGSGEALDAVGCYGWLLRHCPSPFLRSPAAAWFSR